MPQVKMMRIIPHRSYMTRIINTLKSFFKDATLTGANVFMTYIKQSATNEDKSST
jgi:hypothetical protein